MTLRDRLAWFLVGVLAVVSVGANGCGPQPTPVPPSSLGGAPAAGGTPSIGGSQETGGSVATGGLPASGGASTSVAVNWPECNRTVKAPPRVRPPMSGWKKDRERAKRRKSRPNYLVLPEARSVFRQPRVLRALDQGALGSCTGNAVAQSLSTDPFLGQLSEADAVRIYSRATEIDPWKGSYPPNDTGSNGASAWQAAIDLGYYSGRFASVDSLEELQSALQQVPCTLGTDWYDGFFSPSKCGELSISGGVAGGHEPEIIGWDKELRRVWIRNSWGDWGVSRGEETGYAYFSAGTLQKLLNQGAEIDCPTLAF